MVSPAQRRRRLQLVAMVAAAAMVLSLFVGVISALSGNDDASQPDTDEADDPLTPTDPDVILYGDSLAVESAFHFQAELIFENADLEVVPAPEPGMAICDFAEIIERDLADEPPEVAVLTFAGNNRTECVQGEDGEGLTGEALASQYAEDAEAVTELLVDRDVQVLWVGVPPSPGLPGGASQQIDQEYRDLVEDWSDRAPGMIHYSPVGDVVAGPDGEYVERLPCLEDEGDELDEALEEVEGELDDIDDVRCVDGEIRVRSDDEIHFCPVEREDNELLCPTYASGARRYGEAMAEAALELLG